MKHLRKQKEMKSMKYKFCPKCELNMIREDELMCSVCLCEDNKTLTTIEKKQAKINFVEKEERLKINKTKISEIKVGDEINNLEIMQCFGCSGQGGMRRSLRTNSLILVEDVDSIYDDVWKDGICYYTGMGKVGDQTFEYKQNKTLLELPYNNVEAYLFKYFNKKYKFMGKVVLADKPYYDRQLDEKRQVRRVCIFPLRVKKSETDRGYLTNYNIDSSIK